MYMFVYDVYPVSLCLCCQVLLKYGACAWPINCNKITPYELAASGHHNDVAKLLGESSLLNLNMSYYVCIVIFPVAYSSWIIHVE